MKIFALDVIASFGPNSKGMEAERLIDTDGRERLSTRLWDTGRRAIEVLENAAKGNGEYQGLHQMAEMFPSFVREMTSFLDEEIRPSILELQAKGVLTLESDTGRGVVKATEFDETWAEYDFASKAEFFARMMGDRPDVLHEVPDFFPTVQRIAAAAVLIRLGDAVLADIFDNGLDEAVSSIENLRTHLEAPKNAFLMIDVLKSQARKEVAKSGANVRHTKDSDGKQALKRQVKECWDTWQKQPDRYRGKAAFARDMLDKYEALQSQDVIERWCRGWEKGTQPAQ